MFFSAIKIVSLTFLFTKTNFYESQADFLESLSRNSFIGSL